MCTLGTRKSSSDQQVSKFETSESPIQVGETRVSIEVAAQLGGAGQGNGAESGLLVCYQGYGANLASQFFVALLQQQQQHMVVLCFYGLFFKKEPKYVF